MEMGLGNSLVYPGRYTGVPGVQVPAAHAKLLLHFEGDFADSSVNQRVYQPVGSPQISTVEKVFGDSSYLSDGSDRIGYQASSDFNFGDNIPTQLSFRILHNTAPAENWLGGTQNGNGSVGYTLRFRSSWTDFQFVSLGAVGGSWNVVHPSGVWAAYRLNHDGANNYRLYKDGVLLGVQNFTVTDTSKDFRFGAAWDGGAGLSGNVDELLFEKHPDLVITTSPTYEVETKPFIIV
ncbi:MAG: LamG domain-containing protein [Nitrospinae bacterium]|nr:LamG domain-containing protein [Nitrospinota bacterium]